MAEFFPLVKLYLIDLWVKDKRGSESNMLDTLSHIESFNQSIKSIYKHLTEYSQCARCGLKMNHNKSFLVSIDITAL